MAASCETSIKAVFYYWSGNVFYFMGAHKMKRNQMAGIPQILAKETSKSGWPWVSCVIELTHSISN